MIYSSVNTPWPHFMIPSLTVGIIKVNIFVNIKYWSQINEIIPPRDSTTFLAIIMYI